MSEPNSDVPPAHGRPWWNSYIPATGLIALGRAEVVREIDDIVDAAHGLTSGHQESE
jgi:hypothetical protein